MLTSGSCEEEGGLWQFRIHPVQFFVTRAGHVQLSQVESFCGGFTLLSGWSHWCPW